MFRRNAMSLVNSSSVHELGAWGWQMYLNRGMKHAHVTPRMFASLKKMYIRDSEKHVDVFIDGELYGNSSLWIPNGSSISEVAAATFPRASGMSYTICGAYNGTQVVMVSTGNTNKGNFPGRNERNAVLGINSCHCTDVGECCCDSCTGTPLDNLVRTKMATMIGSSMASSSQMGIKATTQNGVGIADMRDDTNSKHAVGEMWSMGHWTDAGDEVGHRHHHNKHHGYKNYQQPPFCGRRCEDLRLVPLGCREKCLLELSKSRSEHHHHHHELVPYGTRVHNEGLRVIDTMPVLIECGHDGGSHGSAAAAAASPKSSMREMPELVEITSMHNSVGACCGSSSSSGGTKNQGMPSLINANCCGDDDGCGSSSSSSSSDCDIPDLVSMDCVGSLTEEDARIEARRLKRLEKKALRDARRKKNMMLLSSKPQQTGQVPAASQMTPSSSEDVRMPELIAVTYEDVSCCGDGDLVAGKSGGMGGKMGGGSKSGSKMGKKSPSKKDKDKKKKEKKEKKEKKKEKKEEKKRQHREESDDSSSSSGSGSGSSDEDTSKNTGSGINWDRYSLKVSIKDKNKEKKDTPRSSSPPPPPRQQSMASASAASASAAGKGTMRRVTSEYIGCEFAENIVGSCSDSYAGLKGITIVMIPNDKSANEKLDESGTTYKKRIEELIAKNQSGFSKYIKRNTLTFPKHTNITSVLDTLKADAGAQKIAADDFFYSIVIDKNNSIRIEGHSKPATPSAPITNIESISKVSKIFPHSDREGLYVMVLDDLWRQL